MEVLFERVAGLDVGKATLTVCVRTPGPRGNRRADMRTFSTIDPLPGAVPHGGHAVPVSRSGSC